MIQAFIENPILMLFAVIGMGYWLGRVRIRGVSLGVAAVLFVGLAIGGMNQQLHVPESMVFLGLTIFIYTIGLSSGPSFFNALRKRGLKDAYFVMGSLAFSLLLVAAAYFIFDFSAAAASGVFAGSNTNTPALAGLIDAIRNLSETPAVIKDWSESAVVGYSLTYPFGIFGGILAIQFLIKWLNIDFEKEADELQEEYPMKRDIVSEVVTVKHSTFDNMTIRDIKKLKSWKVVFGRIERGDEVLLTNWDSLIKVGDKVAVIGREEEVKEVVNAFGEATPYDVPSSQSEYETKRIFVSSPKIAGEKLATLNLGEKFSAIVTRIRRGDVDLIANGETVIELGDQVIFIARRKDVPKIREFFGDSYEELGKINLLSFGLGMALGLLLGMITFKLPGGIDFKLGFAGGPILVALLLGNLRRTGPIVWSLPYNANVTLRQFGLIIMLAGIGINSGYTFTSTLLNGDSAIILLVGFIVSFLTAAGTLFVGYKFLKIPFSLLVGMVATQPAILDFAIEKTGNKLPIIGYTLILPVSLIVKIIYVQILFAMLN